MVSTLDKLGESSLRALARLPWTADLLETSSHLILYTAIGLCLFVPRPEVFSFKITAHAFLFVELEREDRCHGNRLLNR